MPQPRAMFVAALALAAAHAAPVVRPPRRPLGATALSRRNSTLRRVLAAVGPGLVAAGRARRLFEDRAAMWAHPAVPLHIDARLKAVIASPAVAAAIGEVAPKEDPERAWAEVSDTHVSLFWRGELSQHDGESVLTVCGDRFRAAVQAAAIALNAAGFPTSGLTEIRWLQISPKTHPGAWRTFAGYVGTIGLRRRRPVWILPPTKGAVR